jgi:hypothetical protein
MPPDLTDYYVGGGFPYAGFLVAAVETNLTNNPDPQCASGFICGAPADNFYTSCGLPPGPTAGGCPKYGDYNGMACVPGHFYSAWTSGTAPSPLPAQSGLNIYFARSGVTAGLPIIRLPAWQRIEEVDRGAPNANPRLPSASDLGLTVNYQQDTNNGQGDAGDIVSTTPPANSAVQVGSTVTVEFLGLGPND